MLLPDVPDDVDQLLVQVRAFLVEHRHRHEPQHLEHELGQEPVRSLSDLLLAQREEVHHDVDEADHLRVRLEEESVPEEQPQRVLQVLSQAVEQEAQDEDYSLVVLALDSVEAD